MFQIKKLSDENWTNLPEPKKEGITITDEPIWASNTGRSSSGKMIGDIVDWKTTVQVEWPALSFSDSKRISDAIPRRDAFFKIRYNDYSSGNTVEKTVYCSNIPRTIYSLAQGCRLHIGVTITFIEQ